MSCPEAVTTSTVQAPTGSGGNAVLREYVRYPSRRPPRIGALETLEQEHILATLDRTEWNKSRAAQILGIERKTLYRKLERMKP